MSNTAMFEAKVEVRRKSVRLMATELELVTSAVEVDEYEIAKEFFDSARKIWFRFGGTIKRQSAEAYAKVQETYAASVTAFEGASNNKVLLLSNLHALNAAANDAVVVSDTNL